MRPAPPAPRPPEDVEIRRTEQPAKFSPCRLLAVGSVSLTVGSVLLVGALFFIGVPMYDLIEPRAYDLRVRSRGHLQPSPALALAVIDEKSLDAEGRWLRPKPAALVDRLSREGAC